MAIKVPTQATLSKYGITADEWGVILKNQKGVCGVCGVEPSSGRLNIDHEHIKGWKKMLPEERRKYIRGLLCYICNHRILTRGVTIAKLINAVRYLALYERGKYGKGKES